jgi:hypothetical protein
MAMRRAHVRMRVVKHTVGRLERLALQPAHRTTSTHVNGAPACQVSLWGEGIRMHDERLKWTTTAIYQKTCGLRAARS